MTHNITKELLFEYFAGRLTPMQQSMIAAWLKEDENEEFYFECLEEWERASPQYLPDVAEAAQRYQSAMTLENENMTHPSPNKRFTFPFSKKWASIAAAILIITAAIGYFTSDFIFYKTYQTQYGETQTLILDDQSQVILNANTTLRVPRHLASNTLREVWLTGEAFFNISKKENKQKFLVHTDNLSIEVLGTKFNVSDRRQATKVVLQEGKVKVVSNTNEETILKDIGDYAEVSSEQKKLVKKNVKQELYTVWQEKRLMFENTPLTEVLQTIEDYYGIKIGVKDTVMLKKYFTGTLPNNDLDVILKALSSIYGWNVNDIDTSKVK